MRDMKERTWKHGRNQNLFYPETMGGTCLYGISDRGHVQRDLHHRPAAPYSSFEVNIKGTITDFASAPKARTPSRDHIQTKRGTILQMNCASFRFLIRLPRSDPQRSVFLKNVRLRSRTSRFFTARSMQGTPPCAGCPTSYRYRKACKNSRSSGRKTRLSASFRMCRHAS